MPDIDVAAATEALNNAGGVENLMRDEAAGSLGNTVVAPATAPTPSQQQQVQPVEGQPAPQQAQPVPSLMRDPVTGRWVRADQQAPAEQSTEQQAEAFTQLDPNTLDPSLQQFYKSMQADYTRKTQELAAQRAQYEQLGPLDEIQQALGVYSQLQDPQSWGQLHAELTEGMKALGLTPAEAEQAATEAITQQATPQGDPLAAIGDDPDLAPIKTAYQELQQQLTDLKSQYENDRQAQEAEQLQMAVLGEFQRQENIIRQGNPNYTDDDLKAIYELSSYHDGNLLQAQQRYDSIFNDRMGRYLEGKQGVADHVVSLPGAATATFQPPTRPRTLDEGHAMAMEALRQIEASGQ